MLHNPTGMWQQVCFTMTKHAHRVSNLAKGDVDLVGSFDQNMELFVWWFNTHNFQICV